MKLLKEPLVNIVFISLLSIFYSFIYIFTAGHMEFVSLLSHARTLNSTLWNGWSDFIATGNMRFLGYIIIALTIVIIVIIIMKRKKKYDEYQVSILAKSLIVTGILSILMIPILMLLLLSDPNYTLETIFLFATVQWLSLLVSYLLYVIKF
ncbi:hypothetical protein [Paucisalibacillus globulus]|uniref:hypothetical protein n=1 Tax=Paucisalibacillus globulus TaxID=351095 RepID=UPI000BB67C03|nr:hypothetical protein [Paucisalibacillus globulus]